MKTDRWSELLTKIKEVWRNIIDNEDPNATHSSFEDIEVMVSIHMLKWVSCFRGITLHKEHKAF